MLVAVFFSQGQRLGWLLAGLGVAALLALLNHIRVYRVAPYLLLRVVLWACVHAGGLHATLAGVLLAIFIPTRPPPDYGALMAQDDAILSTEALPRDEALGPGHAEPVLPRRDEIPQPTEPPTDPPLR